MCGIVGVYSALPAGKRQAVLDDMTRALRHRGPDHQGLWWDDRFPIGLGQRRLAIVDLTPDGHQPMVSRTGRYVISFNGEIYNFPTLRDELILRGVAFHGRSDTEVLLGAIETWGLNATCQKINGMFAMILWDRQQQELHLIRDRMGKKPLYFGWAGNDFVCASELRALMAHPEFNRRISQAALVHYLHLGFIPAPYSIFADVSMLLPGARMMIPISELKPGTDLRGRMENYWSPARVIEDTRARRTSSANLTATDRIRTTEEVIERATQARMMADVPLGAFLSGGIDSSLVVALMKKNSVQRVKTYTIGFEETGYDESGPARAVAAHLGTDHHEQILKADDALAIVADLPRLCDEPMADVSFLPTYLVARFARQDVTVALTGDGGDEVFGGYHRHIRIQKILRLLNALPGSMRPMVGQMVAIYGLPILRILKPRDPQFETRVAKIAAAMTQKNLPDMYECIIGQAEENKIAQIARPLYGYPFRTSACWPTGLTVSEWMMFADTIHYLPGDILTKVDRATMAVSLEARAPLLDMNVFAHAWTLPMADKIRNGKGKQILRDILARHVPRELFEREKQGFAVPIGVWLDGPLRLRAQRYITGGILTDRLGLNPDDLRAVWNAHISGSRSVSQTLWRLLVLAQWAEEYLSVDPVKKV